MRNRPVLVQFTYTLERVGHQECYGGPHFLLGLIFIRVLLESPRTRIERRRAEIRDGENKKKKKKRLLANKTLDSTCVPSLGASFRL
jgi:hypothetical protein